MTPVSSFGDAFELLLMEQHDVFTRAQARECGVSHSTMRAHLVARRWQRVFDGVLVAHHETMDESATLWAALLASGRGALISHESAAYLHRLVTTMPDRIHVSVPAGRNPARREGVEVHRTRHQMVRAASRRLPQTSVEDTVLDLISDARRADQVVALVVAAISKRQTTTDRLAAGLAGRSHCRWRNLLNDLLADSLGIESALEWRFLHRVVRPHGLPEGIRQRVVSIDGGKLRRDVDYEEWGVLVELDGRLGHEGMGAFKDMDRDNAAAVRGEVSLRYGWYDVAGGPCAAAWQLAQVLRVRGWTGTFLRCPDCPSRG